MGVVMVVVGLIVLLVLWRGLSQGRGGARCRWPALCQRCGYPLIGLGWDRACPECGLSVSKSLSSDARPGTAWQRRVRDGRSWLAALGRTWIDAILRPSRVGTELRCGDPSAHGGTLLTIASVMHFLLAIASMSLAIFVVGWMRGRTGWGLARLVDDSFMVFLVAASIMGIALGLVLLASSLMATSFSVFKRQRVLTATWHGANHLNGWLLVLHALGWACFSFAVCFIGTHWARSFAQSLKINHELMLLSPFFLVIFAGLVVYLVLLWRITLAARYANA